MGCNVAGLWEAVLCMSVHVSLLVTFAYLLMFSVIALDDACTHRVSWEDLVTMRVFHCRPCYSGQIWLDISLSLAHICRTSSEVPFRILFFQKPVSLDFAV